MNRLLQEFDRLYAAVPTGPVAEVATTRPMAAGDGVNAATDGTTAAVALLDAEGATRALVLALRGPAEWPPLARVWGGVQTEFGWPAPAIAVSGDDSLQLWFSLAVPVGPARAEALLRGLCRRYLADIDTVRVTTWPRPSRPVDGAAPAAPASQPSASAAAVAAAARGPDTTTAHAASVPAQRAEERWSAFVAADLAPLFAETPWLDVPPGDDGQARLLAGLRSIDAADVGKALAEPTAAPAPAALPAAPPVARPPPSRAVDHPAPFSSGPGPDMGALRQQALALMAEVLRDATLPLAQRMEAAAALLRLSPDDPAGRSR